VVGAPLGDSTSAQFWVDADRWRLLRIIQREASAPDEISDIRFTRFIDLLDVPVPTVVEVYRNGRLVERREMSDLTANRPLPARAFDLTRWRRLNSPQRSPANDR